MLNLYVAQFCNCNVQTKNKILNYSFIFILKLKKINKIIMAYKIAVFDAKQYDEENFESVNVKFGYEFTFFKEHLDKKNAILARGSDAVCIFVNAIADAEAIKILSEIGIKIIALRCAGFNNVDISAAEKYGIKVVRVPSYSPHAIAEHTLALMLCLNRKIHRAYLRIKENNFSLNGLMGFDMVGKTVGVIGTGKIGLVMIGLLKGLGMNVLAYDLYPRKDEADRIGFSYASLDEIYAQSDIITLHCPLTEETKYLICEESINKMKEGVMIINTGRGSLINTKDLIEGLLTRKVGYAGLDVYEEEGSYFYEDFSDRIITDDVLARLLSFNNVIVTSHQAFFTKEAMANIATTTLQNIKDFEEGRRLENEVTFHN